MLKHIALVAALAAALSGGGIPAAARAAGALDTDATNYAQVVYFHYYEGRRSGLSQGDANDRAQRFAKTLPVRAALVHHGKAAVEAVDAAIDAAVGGYDFALPFKDAVVPAN